MTIDEATRMIQHHGKRKNPVSFMATRESLIMFMELLDIDGTLRSRAKNRGRGLGGVRGKKKYFRARSLR